MTNKFVINSLKIAIAFSVFLLAITSLFEMLYASAEYPMWKSKTEYAKKKDIQNIILGDSRAVVAFEPRMYREKYYNLALGGGTPIEAYFILKKILDNNQLEKVIISFAPMHFEFSDIFFERTLKYNFFTSVSELNEVMCLSKKLNNKFFINSSADMELRELENERKFPKDLDVEYALVAAETDNKYLNKQDYYMNFLKALMTYYKFPYFYLGELKNLTNLKYGVNKKIYNEIKENKGQYFFGTLKECSELNLEASRNTFIRSPVMLYYLNQILKMANEHNIQLFYINTPFNKSSYKKMNDEYIQGYTNYFESIKSNYPNFYWSEDIFNYEDNCFGDPSHLNPKGVQKFRKKVKTIIED